ncbi:MAG TPA: crosslink repair DNA glycosylase YcaQ family protein [Kofleriaceae bacterium]|nr:crosslink repair DNA glycosylase YcaQ family protein [Kofleriaceae bacterium]
MKTLSIEVARRIALAAQGLAGPRPKRADARRVIDRVQLIQIDSVNVLVRAQELPLWARLGAHERDALPKLVEKRALFEYWGHEASLLPVDYHPLLRWRMDAAKRGERVWGHIRRMGRDKPQYIARILDEIRARGPVAASQLEDAAKHGRAEKWWGWGDHKTAIEWLFWTGQVAASHRLSSFERVYDLAERVIPAHILAAPTPSPDDARTELLRRASRALGVATAGDLADYFRIQRPHARPLIDRLVEEGALTKVAVDGWREPAYLHPDADAPRTATARTLISPFDSLIWERARTERLFDFRYRIEIYTPPPKRVHGYYVLPFLMDDRLVARVDLKSDRDASALLARAAYAEPHADRKAVARALADELRAMASWLGLERVKVARKGDLARDLSAASR